MALEERERGRVVTTRPRTINLPAHPDFELREPDDHTVELWHVRTPGHEHLVARFSQLGTTGGSIEKAVRFHEDRERD